MTSQPRVKCFACLSQSQTDEERSHTRTQHTTIVQVHRYVHTKQMTQNTHTDAHAYTLSLSPSLSLVPAQLECQSVTGAFENL